MARLEDKMTAAIRLFPMDRRHGRIERVAEAMDEASSDRVADRYAGFVADRMFGELELLGLDELAQDEAVGAFFVEVERALVARRDAQPVSADIIALPRAWAGATAAETREA